jgi:hypothetical protein
MIKSIVPSAAAVLLGVSAANAQELPASASNRSESLSGIAIDAVKTAADVTRGVRDTAAVTSLAQALVKANTLKTRIRGKRFDWVTYRHPSLERVVLRRAIAVGEVPPTSDEYLSDLRANQTSVTDASLLQRANAVAAAMKANGTFSPDETFVPVLQGGGALGMFDSTGKPTETLISERRIVFRRHVVGIPVVGRTGEFEVRFDVAGEVMEMEVPSDNYTAGKTSLVATQGRSSLVTAMRALGFSDLPALGGTASKDGLAFKLDDLHCGLVDEGSGHQLQRGCYIRYISRSAPAEGIIEF